MIVPVWWIFIHETEIKIVYTHLTKTKEKIDHPIYNPGKEILIMSEFIPLVVCGLHGGDING